MCEAYILHLQSLYLVFQIGYFRLAKVSVGVDGQESLTHSVIFVLYLEPYSMMTFWAVRHAEVCNPRPQ